MDKHLETFTDVNRLVFCKGRLTNAPIPVQAKCQILLDGLLPLTKLIILDINEKQKYISLKQTLIEFCQKL